MPPDFKKDLWSDTKPKKEETRSWETKLPERMTPLTVKPQGLTTVLPSPMEWEFPVAKPSKIPAKLEPFPSKSKSWESPFSDIDMSPKDSKYAEFKDGTHAKKKYFVINADEEMNILCHAPDA